PRYIADRGLLLAWAEPVDMHFTLGPQARTTGSALLVVPLQFERTPPGTPVVIPAAFVDCRRVGGDGRTLRPATESRLASNLRLQLQIPASVLQLAVESARLTLRLPAPSRDVVVTFAGDAANPRRLTNPLGTEQIIFADPAIPTARLVKVFPPRLVDLWLRALNRPETDLKCQAAAAIALAHRRGMPGLEATVVPLIRTLDQPDQHPAVRLAAAQALV